LQGLTKNPLRTLPHALSDGPPGLISYGHTPFGKDTTITSISIKMKRLAFTATATAAATVALAATAHAGVPPSFQTPSGNILCWIADDAATCRIIDYTYASAPADACSTPGFANEFWLDAAKPAELRCSPEPPGAYSGLRAHTTLEYGQSRSVGVMTCVSEASGVTCTGTSTGHFFHVSRDSYQLG
jgi:hypothetical protein